ncbi:MAG: glycosyltransferase family 4 protein [Gilvibacter sp.]
MSKKVLIITNYYPPEMGAAANRIQELALQLNSLGCEVTILCPLPNYPFGKIFDNYPKKGPFTETIKGIKAIRLTTYATKSTERVKRFKGMFAFARSVSSYLKNNEVPSNIIVQSPPLLVSYFSIRSLAKSGQAPILNVSDLWPIAGVELGALKKGVMHRYFLRMERYIYSNAKLICGQSNEILTHVKTIVPQAKTQLYRNFPSPEVAQTVIKPKGSVRLIYAGLLGTAQGILDLCEHIQLPINWELDLYGEGTEAAQVVQYLETSSKQINYKGSLTKEALHELLPTYHLSLVPLKKRIYGSVPSKIFELAHFGMPIIYFGDGEAASLITQHGLGWATQNFSFDQLNSLLTKIESEREAWPTPREIMNTAQHEFVSKRQVAELYGHLD